MCLVITDNNLSGLVASIMGTSAFEGSTYATVYQSLLLVFSVLAAICSVVILYLIYKMKLNNGHILLIKTMSWFQLMYDLTLFTRSVDLGSSAVVQISFVGQIVGGLVGTFISNVIAYIAYFVVAHIKAIPVLQYYPYIMIVIAIPTTVNVVLYIISCFPGYTGMQTIAMADLYYYLRLISIGINFILSFATVYQIRQRRSHTDMAKSIHQEAIETLSLRLIYYPVVQTISRAAVAWYEIAYNFDLAPTSPTRDEFIGLCFVAVFTPSASFGYLMIFLLMQPNAWDCLKSLILCRPYVPKRTAVLGTGDSSRLQSRDSQPQQQQPQEVTTKSTLHSRGTGVATHDSEQSGDMIEQCVYPDHYGGSTLGGAESSAVIGKMAEVDDDDLWFVVSNNRSTVGMRNISAERADSSGM